MSKFFGSLLLALYDLTHCMAGALLIYAAFIAFILTPFVKTFVLDGKKAEHIQAELDKADPLFKKNKSAYAEQVSKLFQRYNILVFLPSLNFVARLLFGLILIWGFNSPDLKALELNLFGAEFALSCKALFAAGGMSKKVVFLVAGLAIVQEYYLDRIVTEKLPYDQGIPDLISIIVLIVLAIFLPMAFSFYWFFSSLFDHLLYKYYSKNKKQQEKIQQELDDIIAGKSSKDKDKAQKKKRRIKRL